MAGDRHVLDTNPVPAPSPTGSVYITEAKCPLLAVGGGGSSGHSWRSFHNSTHLSSHGNITALFRHCLGNNFAKAHTLQHRKPGYIWETLLGQGSLVSLGRLNSLTDYLPSLNSEGVAFLSELSRGLIM